MTEMSHDRVCDPVADSDREKKRGAAIKLWKVRKVRFLIRISEFGINDWKWQVNKLKTSQREHSCAAVARAHRMSTRAHGDTRACPYTRHSYK